MVRYSNSVANKRRTKQRDRARADQVANNAGGFVFKLDKWQRLERFLILGADSQTYYVDQNNLARNNAEAVEKCIKEDGIRTVNTIVQISTSYRAPKNEPAIFALALAQAIGDKDTRRAAKDALCKVARTGTHLFHWADTTKTIGGWGRLTRQAISSWYNRNVVNVAYQAVKYQGRRVDEGKANSRWTHRDLLRLGHVKPASESHNQLFRWITKGQKPDAQGLDLVRAFELAQVSDEDNLIELIRNYGLTHEMIPTNRKKSAKVWEALLLNTPAKALLRNLSTLSRLGLTEPFSSSLKFVLAKFEDSKYIKSLHPLDVLKAIRGYEAGVSIEGSCSWTISKDILTGLDSLFYRTFDNIEPSGKNMLFALDVSGSMGCAFSGSNGMMSCRDATAVLTMVSVAKEPHTHVVGFTSTGSWWDAAGKTQLEQLNIRKGISLSEAISNVSRQDFGATDCALPMLYAKENKLDVDTFIVLTDNETWAGNIHPYQALKKYRLAMNKPQAKLIVVGMTSTGFSIADPNDPLQLDVVGFDTSTPALISNFARGQL